MLVEGIAGRVLLCTHVSVLLESLLLPLRPVLKRLIFPLHAKEVVDTCPRCVTGTLCTEPQMLSYFLVNIHLNKLECSLD